MAELSGRNLAQDIALCIGFFTRLPLGPKAITRSFAEALWAAPIAGALIGAIVGLSVALFLVFGLSPAIAAALGIAVSVVLTGALHEDGLADVADGFGGGRDREAKLAIMRDSRIGTYGVIAVTLSLLLRWLALSVLAAAESGIALVGVMIAAHAASRALLPGFIDKVAAARSDGLGASVGQISSRTVTVALVLGALSLTPLGWPGLFLAVVLLTLLTWAVAALCRNQIGGQTGDVLGALQQGAETLVLILASTFAAEIQ